MNALSKRIRNNILFCLIGIGISYIYLYLDYIITYVSNKKEIINTIESKRIDVIINSSVVDDNFIATLLTINLIIVSAIGVVQVILVYKGFSTYISFFKADYTKIVLFRKTIFKINFDLSLSALFLVFFFFISLSHKNAIAKSYIYINEDIILEYLDRRHAKIRFHICDNNNFQTKDNAEALKLFEQYRSEVKTLDKKNKYVKTKFSRRFCEGNIKKGKSKIINIRHYLYERVNDTFCQKVLIHEVIPYDPKIKHVFEILFNDTICNDSISLCLEFYPKFYIQTINQLSDLWHALIYIKALRFEESLALIRDLIFDAHQYLDTGYLSTENYRFSNSVVGLYHFGGLVYYTQYINHLHNSPLNKINVANLDSAAMFIENAIKYQVNHEKNYYFHSLLTKIYCERIILLEEDRYKGINISDTSNIKNIHPELYHEIIVCLKLLNVYKVLENNQSESNITRFCDKKNFIDKKLNFNNLQ